MDPCQNSPSTTHGSPIVRLFPWQMTPPKAVPASDGPAFALVELASRALCVSGCGATGPETFDGGFCLGFVVGEIQWHEEKLDGQLFNFLGGEPVELVHDFPNGGSVSGSRGGAELEPDFCRHLVPAGEADAAEVLGLETKAAAMHLGGVGADEESGNACHQNNPQLGKRPSFRGDVIEMPSSMKCFGSVLAW